MTLVPDLSSTLWPGWWRSMLLRLVVFVGPVVALLATAPAGNTPGPWLLALTVVLAAGFAAMPESALGTTALCVVVVWWGFALEQVVVEVLIAGVALLAAHLCAVLLSYGPAQLPVDGRVLGLWVRRGMLAGLSLPALWLLATLFEGQPEPPGVWLAALVAGIVVCVVAAVAVTERAPG
jgi:hypothetical protein